MYEVKYNKQARQFDVIDENKEIVAMFGGGKRGEIEAKRYAENINKYESAR